MRANPERGQLWRHFKEGTIYTIVEVGEWAGGFTNFRCIHGGEAIVAYRQIGPRKDESLKTYFRTLSEFMDELPYWQEDNLTGQKYRFEKVESSW